jgi:hypothetical protein
VFSVLIMSEDCDHTVIYCMYFTFPLRIVTKFFVVITFQQNVSIGKFMP